MVAKIVVTLRRPERDAILLCFMKKIVLIISICFNNFSYSQNRNNIWMIGGEFPNHNCGLDFNSVVVDTFTVYRNLGFFITNAGICDTTGQLLFYTNGDYIENRNYQRLQNCTNFNPTITGDTTYGLNGCQAVLILPYPANPDKYYVFHLNGESFTAHSQGEFQPLRLWYSVVDMTLDGGLGGVVGNRKTVEIIADTMTWGRLTACKHANGRDWWVIMHRYYSDMYYKLLVTLDTIIVSTQNIGSVITSDIGGQAVFSQDGTMFAMVSPSAVDQLDIFQFDRCTGTFYNSVTITTPTIYSPLGCSFSPGGRFLYVSTNLNVFQYDTWAGNIAASVNTVATWDSTYSPGATYFFMHCLAPDGKIYISTFQGTDVLHVIHNPDNLGVSCNLTQHSILLPSYNALSFPNAVNYDLMALGGSLCDTLGLPNVVYNLVEQNDRLNAFPNPTTGILTVKFKSNVSSEYSLKITDVAGRQLKLIVGKAAEGVNFRQLDLSLFSKGIYFINLTGMDKNEKIWAIKE